LVGTTLYSCASLCFVFFCRFCLPSPSFMVSDLIFDTDWGERTEKRTFFYTLYLCVMRVDVLWCRKMGIGARKNPFVAQGAKGPKRFCCIRCESRSCLLSLSLFFLSLFFRQAKSSCPSRRDRQAPQPATQTSTSLCSFLVPGDTEFPFGFQTYSSDEFPLAVCLNGKRYVANFNLSAPAVQSFAFGSIRPRASPTIFHNIDQQRSRQRLSWFDMWLWREQSHHKWPRKAFVAPLGELSLFFSLQASSLASRARRSAQ
jgi:hypothetical protein